MSELLEIHSYPLTAAQGITHAKTFVDYSGIEGDRQYLVYRALEPSERGVFPRLTQDGQPLLTQLSAKPTPDGLLISKPAIAGCGQLLVAKTHRGDRIHIDDLGDTVECTDLGDSYACWISNVLDQPGLRLAKKITELIPGFNAAIPPSNRRNAPLHIVDSDIAGRLSQVPEVGIDSLRPNLIMSEFRPQRDWVGKYMRIGELTIQVTRLLGHERGPASAYAAPVIRTPTVRPHIAVGNQLIIRA